MVTLQKTFKYKGDSPILTIIFFSMKKTPLCITPASWCCTSALVACLLLCPQLHGQSIKGKVLEMDGKPLSFVNVLLLNSSDSSLVKGAVSDALGDYFFDNIGLGNYLLSASMVGYKRGYLSLLNIKPSKTPLEVGNLTLSEDAKQLEEVMIVEKRPFVEQHIDRMVVNVANSIIASGSTVLEVLEKAPGVTLDRQNDMLQLRGKDGVIVQIDGKQTYLSMPDVVALLRSMSSDNVDQIDLITNPSAKYDAAGNSGIINIRLKKNNNVGTNGSVSLSGGSGRFDRESGSVQINHRTNKFNLFGNYSANRGGDYFDLRTKQTRDNDGDEIFTHQDTYIRFRQWGQNAKVGVDYFLSENTNLGAVWTGFWNDLQEQGTAESAFRREASGPMFLHAKTDKSISNISFNHIFNVHFQHTFKTQGQLSIDFDKGRYDRDFTNTLLTHILISENNDDPSAGLYTEMPTTIDITTFKMDYERTFTSGWKMETGIKSSTVRNDNDLMLSRGVEELVPDLDLSNHFLYTERVNAIYSSFGRKLNDKTDIQLGLRAEHTHSVGNSLTSNNFVDRDYLNLFPSLFISRQLQKNHSLTFSYSYRIDRPNYQFLNPGRSYVDPYLYSQGNAYLNPQYTQSLEFRHGYREKIFTSLGTSYISDLIFYVIQPVDSTTTERTPLNIGSSQAYNLTITFPFTFVKGWTMQTTLMGNYSRFQYTYQDTPLTIEQFSGQLNGSNSFVLGKGWTAELTGWLKTPGVNAIVRSPWLGTMDIGIQKAVGSKLKAKLSLQDVFRTNMFLGKIDAPGFRSDLRLNFDTRIVMLNLTYSFGNQQLKGIRQRRTGSEEETQRTN